MFSVDFTENEIFELLCLFQLVGHSPAFDYNPDYQHLYDKYKPRFFDALSCGVHTVTAEEGCVVL